jgi:hypothetical protein
MNGMVTATKTTTRGKAKGIHSMYHIQFLDNEKLRCGLDLVKEMQATYVSCRAKYAQKAAGVNKPLPSLHPEGFEVCTTWMPEMSALSEGCKPPSCCMGKFDSWLRKTKIMKFHAALNEYELLYSCGYTRYVKLGDMQQMVLDSGDYLENRRSRTKCS